MIEHTITEQENSDLKVITSNIDIIIERLSLIREWGGKRVIEENNTISLSHEEAEKLSRILNEALTNKIN